MAKIRYYIPDEWQQSEEEVYINYYQEKSQEILNILKEQKNYQSNVTASKINSALGELEFDFDNFINNINFATMSLDDNIQNLYQSYYEAVNKVRGGITNFNVAAKDLMAISNLPEGSKFQIKNPDSILQGKRIGKLTLDNIKQDIGQIGESTSAIVAKIIANTLLNGFMEQGSAISNIDIKYTNTGGERTESTFGNIPMGVQRQTDNVLEINFTKDGVDMKLKFNISDKGSINLRKQGASRQAKTIYLRSSTINNFLDQLNADYVYNTLSYHRENKTGASYIQASSAIQELKKTLGHYLLYDAMREVRTKLNGEQIDDAVDFTIYGGRVVAENTIYEDFKNQMKNGDLKANISGLSKLKTMKTVRMAEDHISKMKVTLQAKI